MPARLCLTQLLQMVICLVHAVLRLHVNDVVGGVQAGGSGVVVSPITYIFEEEPARWRKLLDSLDLEH